MKGEKYTAYVNYPARKSMEAATWITVPKSVQASRLLAGPIAAFPANAQPCHRCLDR
jgi:hypothetical protein